MRRTSIPRVVSVLAILFGVVVLPTPAFAANDLSTAKVDFRCTTVAGQREGTWSVASSVAIPGTVISAEADNGAVLVKLANKGIVSNAPLAIPFEVRPGGPSSASLTIVVSWPLRPDGENTSATLTQTVQVPACQPKPGGKLTSLCDGTVVVNPTNGTFEEMGTVGGTATIRVTAAGGFDSGPIVLEPWHPGNSIQIPRVNASSVKIEYNGTVVTSGGYQAKAGCYGAPAAGGGSGGANPGATRPVAAPSSSMEPATPSTSDASATSQEPVTTTVPTRVDLDLTKANAATGTGAALWVSAAGAVVVFAGAAAWIWYRRRPVDPADPVAEQPHHQPWRDQ